MVVATSLVIDRINNQSENMTSRSIWNKRRAIGVARMFHLVHSAEYVMWTWDCN